MDCRSAAHVLTQIATLLELHGEARATVRAMQLAARSVAAEDSLDFADAMGKSAFGALSLSPQAMDVLQDLAESNSSALLEQLQEKTPEGLLAMLRVPGVGPTRVRQIHVGLHIESLFELEQSARDGRLASLPRFGVRTAEKILKGIVDLRESGAFVLWQHAMAEAERMRSVIAALPGVARVEIAGAIRRRNELVRDIDLVVVVREPVAHMFAVLGDLAGVREVLGRDTGALRLRLDAGVTLNIACVVASHLPIALWRATGNAAHVQQLRERAEAQGLSFSGNELRGPQSDVRRVHDERDLYAQLELAYCEPELREGVGEVAAAARNALPTLVTRVDLVGALHCHSQYSDGGASIVEMATAARTAGLRYLGISDHSQSNPYAGGLSHDAIVAQHQEIDDLNASYRRDGVDFRVLKGIEADILPCGRVDYDARILDRFDFVIGSVHTRYGMNERQMTERVLKALDDPHLTILGHPTGRLLLAREPYEIDLRAVIEKAGRVGVAVELNADPHRVDIDWQACRIAVECGTLVSIGPDAHSPQGLENLELGIAAARKGWMSAANVLNTRTADEVLTFASARRALAGTRSV